MAPRLLEQQACVAAFPIYSGGGEAPLAPAYTVIFIVRPLYRDRGRLLINAFLSLKRTARARRHRLLALLLHPPPPASSLIVLDAFLVLLLVHCRIRSDFMDDLGSFISS